MLKLRGGMKEHKKKPNKFKEQQARHKGYALVYEAKKQLDSANSIELEVFGVKYTLVRAQTELDFRGEYCLVKFNKGIILCEVGPTYRGLNSIPSWNGYYITNKKNTRLPKGINHSSSIIARVANLVFTRPMEDSQFKQDMISRYGQSVLVTI